MLLQVPKLVLHIYTTHTKVILLVDTVACGSIKYVFYILEGVHTPEKEFKVPRLYDAESFPLGSA